MSIVVWHIDVQSLLPEITYVTLIEDTMMR